mmetsp:Transcript_32386/g.70432  ORF Transcript_32386/g.70432 Transcript_32386/m.70432 type:complete len:95 (+) Transcript_32386:89-373(+)
MQMAFFCWLVPNTMSIFTLLFIFFQVSNCLGQFFNLNKAFADLEGKGVNLLPFKLRWLFLQCVNTYILLMKISWLNMIPNKPIDYAMNLNSFEG